MAETKKKDMSWEGIMAKIEKDYGKGSVINATEKPEEIETISTGSLSLDRATGVRGYPIGRVIEIYGPFSSGKTTLCLHAIAEGQKKYPDKKFVFIDVEHALDIKYTRSLGVNIERLHISQPDYGEQALEIADRLISSGDVGVMVIDSVAALVPKSELDGEMGDSSIGKQARLMGQAMRKLTAMVESTGTLLIFTNQIREKIGVMFGCLHADMPVVFTDGRSIPIRKVVEEKIEGSVWSYNENLHIFEEKEITDWHFNGNVTKNEDFIHIETPSIDGGGRFGITVTPNHRLFTSAGWKEAKDIKEEDRLLSKYSSITGTDGEEFLKGCLVGDSHLSTRDKNTAALRFQDSNNAEYINWKMDVLSCLDFKEVPSNGHKRYDSEYTYEFAKMKRQIGNRNPVLIFEEYEGQGIPWLSMAVWIMDDGNYNKEHKRYTLCVKRSKNDSSILHCITSHFKKMGLVGKFNDEGTFVFTVKSSEVIAEMIRTYIPTCMQYKLPDWAVEKNKVDGITRPNVTKVIREDYVKVLSVRYASDRQMRQKGKYDISIADNCNYLSGGVNNGVVIHNSPETTSGGNALKFYASMRLDIRKKATNKESTAEDAASISNTVKVKIIKNKVAPPFTEADFDIEFGIGIDRVREIFDEGIEKGIITKAGGHHKYNDSYIGHTGKESLQFLRDNSELAEEIATKIITYEKEVA